jgi:hypothetical protein
MMARALFFPVRLTVRLRYTAATIPFADMTKDTFNISKEQ